MRCHFIQPCEVSPRVVFCLIVFSLTVAWVISNNAAAASLDSSPLEPGKTIERTLQAGEAHQYHIDLPAGQYIQVEADKKGIDLNIGISLPNQDAANVIDTDEILFGTESYCAITANAGRYQIHIRPGHKDAMPGRYALRIKQLRGTLPADEQRVNIQSLVSAAHRQIFAETIAAQQTTLEKQLKAVELLENAARTSRQIEDKEIEAAVTFKMGAILTAYVHDQSKAIETFERALRIYRELGDRRGEGSSLYRIGFCYVEIGKMKEAREIFQQGLTITRQIGDQDGEGKILNMLGDTFARESPRAALDSYVLAAPLLQAAGDVQFEADVRTSMGMGWLQLGEPNNAFEALERAQALAARLPWKDPIAVVLDNLSKVHYAVGNFQKALDTQYRSLELRQSIGNSEGAANSFHYLAMTYLDLGETQRAVEFFKQSIKLRLELGYEFRTLRTQSELGIAYHRLGQYQLARDYFLELLPRTRKYTDRFSEGRTLEGLGLAYQSMGDLSKAIEFYGQALAVIRDSQWNAAENRILFETGQAYALLGEFAKARQHFKQVLSLARKGNYPHVEAEALSSIAALDMREGWLAEAQSGLEAALRIIESVRSAVVSPSLRASFLASQHRTYESYVTLLMELHSRNPAAGYAAQALAVSERARARSLTEILAEVSTKIREQIDPALLERERSLRQKLVAKSAAQHRAGSQSEEQAAAFSREITEGAAELEQVEAQIRAASPRYAALTRPQPLGLKEIQQAVVADADTLLLEYSLGEERSFLWAIGRDSFASYELPPRAEIERAARGVYELLTARNQIVKFEEPAARRARIARADAAYPAAAAALGRMILGPVAAQLGKKRLLIVADGALQYVPFAALPVSARLLIEDHEIISLPSASALAVLRRELAGRPPAPRSVAVVADPVFQKTDARLQSVVAQGEKTSASRAAAWREELERSARQIDGEREGFERLPATREEARAAVRYAPPGSSRIALDFAANQAAVMSGDLGQYRYLHFATHGLLNNEHPELSGLVLSLVDETGKDTDGFLRLVDIYGLRLPADLVVLSACRTGLGKEIRGEGLMSLTRGFMYAGASRVMVSLWGVNDRSTAALMTRLYQGLLQDTLAPPAALRKAQLALRADRQWSAPYYWAAFTIQGEPR